MKKAIILRTFEEHCSHFQEYDNNFKSKFTIYKLFDMSCEVLHYYGKCSHCFTEDIAKSFKKLSDVFVLSS